MMPVYTGNRGTAVCWPTGFNIVDGLGGNLDRFVGRVLGGPSGSESPRSPVNVWEDPDRYYFEVEVAGVTKDQIEITLEDGVLTLTGEKRAPAGRDNETLHIRERCYGRFVRQFRLPDDVEENKVAAMLKDGVLTITVDKRDEVKPKKISVNAG